MAVSAFRFDELAPEVFTVVVAFLTGCDLLSLSHVNNVLLNELLGPHSDVWKQRLVVTEADDVASAKYWYYRRRPLRFPGLSHRLGEQADKGGALNIPMNVSELCGHSSFSLSLWFSMDAPTTDPSIISVGGILLGVQPTRWINPEWPNPHDHLIHLDPQGNLYCSVTDELYQVANNLVTCRWHHLVVTYARPGLINQSSQHIFLDGECVHSSSRPLHNFVGRFASWQVGIGFMTGYAQGSPYREPSRLFSGWYGFRGLVDDFCVRDRVLSPAEVRSLSRGGRARDDSVVWSQRVGYALATPQNIKNVIQVGYTCLCDSKGCCIARASMQQREQDARRGFGGLLRRFWRSVEAS